jgi:hypothetical protein
VKKALAIIPLVLLLAGLIFGLGCGIGGASIVLKDMSLGEVSMDGEPVTGLPSEKVNVVLDVSAQSIEISYSPDGSVLTLSPSGATVEITPTGVTIEGVESKDMEIEWVVPEED